MSGHCTLDPSPHCHFYFRLTVAFVNSCGCGLFLVIVNRRGIKVIGLKYEAAFQTANIVNTVASCNHLCSIVLTGALHKERLTLLYLARCACQVGGRVCLPR